MDFTTVAVVLQLIFLECVLSLDNAAVMGAMVAHLPNDKPIPWPTWLAGFGRVTDHLWGSQQNAALKIGLFGAYAGRILMLMIAGFVIKAHWVQMLGALYLIYLAVNHFAGLARHADSLDAGEETMVARGGFWEVVLALNLADMAFSLDNVVAAVALSEHMWVVILGVGIGILAVRFAAGIFTRLIQWEPGLEHTAYLLILAIGAELILDAGFELHTADMVRFAISLSILGGSLLVVRTPLLRPWVIATRPLLNLSALLIRGLELAMTPLRLVLKRS